VDVDGEALVSWDEAVEHRLDKFGIPVPDLLGAEQVFPFEIGGGTRQVLSSDRAGAVRARVVRESWPLSCAARVSAVQLERGIRLRVTVENRSPCPAEPLLARPEALRYALNGTHTLLEVHGGSF